MYLHLGMDVVVPTRSIVGIFDLDTASWSKHTRQWLGAMEAADRVVSVCDDLPTSFVLCAEGGEYVAYLTQISSATLHRRSRRALDV